MAIDEKPAVKKKLKIKVSPVRSADESIEAEHERPSRIFSAVVEMITPRHSRDMSTLDLRGFSQNLSLTSVSMNTFGKEKRTSITTRLNNIVANHSSHDKKMFVTENPKNGSFVTCGSKHGPETVLYGQKVKKHKIDSRVMQHCRALLNKLMIHECGWVFNQPVDPVKLQIPDYFDIISEPMDLGTVKFKLENKLYSGPSEFAADVRLTFSNAMAYNPPANDVHLMARELSVIFELGWRSLQEKWNGKNSKVLQDPISKGRLIKAANARKHCPKSVDSWSDRPPRFSMTYAQKQKLKEDLMEMSKRKAPQHLLCSFRKFGLIGQKEEKIEMDFDAFDEETIWELQRVIRSYLDESADSDSTCGQDSLQKDPHKGSSNSNKCACGSVNSKLLRRPAACSSGSHGDMKCHCIHHNSFAQASSDVDSKRSSGKDNNHACHGGMFNLDTLTNGYANKQMTKSDLDSTGTVITVDEESIEPGSCPTPPEVFASREEYENDIYNGQLSPSKALRVAMLRSRFADTILKAKQKTLLSNGEKVDPLKMQQERERLEKKQREEKARIEAQIKAAATASRIKEETELKLQRKREREAARIALQKMVKTVEIDENKDILKDLEMLSMYNGSMMDEDKAVIGSFHGNLLERLGLFLKDEYLEEEEDKVATGKGDVEEGEIAS